MFVVVYSVRTFLDRKYEKQGKFDKAFSKTDQKRGMKKPCLSTFLYRIDGYLMFDSIQLF